MRPSRDSKEMRCSLTRPVTLRLLRIIKRTGLQPQVNLELAGHSGARISQSLPELQESRLDLRRNRVACSSTNLGFRARLSRPRSSRVRASGGIEGGTNEMDCKLERRAQEEVVTQNEGMILELQVQIDRPKTLLQDKRQELQRKTEVKTPKLE
ncbi:hypothetical protein CesoFtcFv8_000927 [Champsocephalus esox]|uniref:Uncharacterized protein n=1 Tax=Champsocephalus esox TaxID=159716 RepID=A0AAN8D4U9_9TELE|nr:hypothetical protein CesoFtcFv8_000927 [Champsocephalus esox]